jgi:hypothetical protein
VVLISCRLSAYCEPGPVTSYPDVVVRPLWKRINLAFQVADADLSSLKLRSQELRLAQDGHVRPLCFDPKLFQCWMVSEQCE